MITGIHIGTYGRDIGSSLGALVTRLIGDVPATRFRLSSIEATEVDDELTDLLINAPRNLAPHIHAPLQSGSDRLLRRMGRNWYTSATYAAGLERLAANMSVFGFGADVIAGFPAKPMKTTLQRLRWSNGFRSPTSTSFRSRSGRGRPPSASRRRWRPSWRSAGPRSCGPSRSERRRPISRLSRWRSGRRGRSATPASVRGSPAITFSVRLADQALPARRSRCRTSDHERQPPYSAVRSSMTDPRPTVYIETYGCQMNVSDSELMLGKLAAHGYDAVDGPDGADVILVNTCAIRDHAEQRVIGRLGELKRNMKPGAIVGVTGCMAQRLGPQLLDKAKHVSVVIGPDGYRALPALIEAHVAASERSPRRSTSRSTTRTFSLDGSIASRRGFRYSADATIAARTASCRRRAVRNGADSLATWCERSSPRLPTA